MLPLSFALLAVVSAPELLAGVAAVITACAAFLGAINLFRRPRAADPSAPPAVDVRAGLLELAAENGRIAIERNTLEDRVHALEAAMLRAGLDPDAVHP